MNDQSEPTKTSFGRGSSSSFSSIEEGRFPAGTTLAGRFRILGLLGRGGMGEVYRALDLTLNQPVALKFIAPAHTNEAALARFRNEVRIARQVSHPNVCRVYDIGVIEGQHFLSMEYVDGEDLASLLRRIGRLPSDKALEFTRRICAGLAAAHERGVLHRDLKPANVMIDARGQVRITDFGLAALAGEVPGGDIRSGTPAYMSPEQKAGKEVTARSDIYSLGLVMYEMFTGKRRADSQATPTTLIADLDPTIERVILRCLESEPRQRPSSALNVAMALPGGDPIAAALAAGETPSPEMVAASGEKEGLQPRTAVACIAATLLILVALVFLNGKMTLLGRAPLPLPPDALAFKAREMLKQFGYTEEPVDTSYGFFPGDAFQPYQRYLDANDAGQRFERLASHQPALTVFLYRQHQDYLRPGRFLSLQDLTVNSLVTSADPALTEQGMVSISLDAHGRLVRLRAMPSAALMRTPIPAPMDGDSLLAAAGLDRSRFNASPAETFLRVHADSVMAWTGSYSDGRPDTIRVKAASLGGRPVLFEISGPWDQTELTSTPFWQLVVYIVLEILLVALLVTGSIVAWRNVKLGRGDRRAAWRIAMVVFVAVVGSWALVASHVPTLWELLMFLMGVSWAAFQAGFIGLLYLAVEPFVRRHWPDALISWVRIVGGRFRDPLAASHVLVGIVVGLALALVNAAVPFVTNAMTPFGQSTAIFALNGPRFLTVGLLQDLTLMWFGSIGMILILVLLRGMVRRTLIADALWVAFFAVLFAPSPALIPLGVPIFVSRIWALRRFGLLTFIVSTWAENLMADMPIAVGSWYTPLSLTTPVLIAAAAAWSVYVIVTSRPGWASRPATGV